MVTRSKRYKEASTVRDPMASYTLVEATQILDKMSKAKFDETVVLSFRLNVDPRQSSQMVRGTVKLPHGSGKKVRVIAFTEAAQVALDAGADEAGTEDLIKKIQDGWLDFDVAVATPSAMAEVRKLARVLGPRGLMPNPKSGTVSDDIASAISEVKGGRVEFKMDKTANLAVVVGKRSFDMVKLQENAKEVLNVIAGSRPEGLKGGFISSIAISSSMSPSVKIKLSELA